jgi:hypothetical protein
MASSPWPSAPLLRTGAFTTEGALAATGGRRNNVLVRGPDFVMVGAARSGTTTMYGWLRGHPDVFMPKLKEPGYFVDGFGVSDPQEYEKLFVPARGRLAGEATTMYLASPESPGWIRAELGDVPIIVLLRDPVARAFSLYTWMHQNGWEPIGEFERALAAEPGRAADPESLARYKQCLCDYMYFGSGMYSEQVRAYQERFSAVKVLLLDDLQTDPQGSFDAVCDFLGLRRHPIVRPGRSNVGRRPRAPRLQLSVRRAILRHEERRSVVSHGAVVALWWAVRQNVRLGRAVRIDAATGRVLRERFADDVERTAELIGRDLSAWLPPARRERSPRAGAPRLDA